MISYFKLLMLLLSILLFWNCTNQKKSGNTETEQIMPYPHTINMSEALQNKTKLKLSDIADSINYIVLAKDKSVLIGNAGKIQMNDRNIFVKSENLIMRFDLSGKFLNYFGKIGRGPEEYLPGSPYSTTPGFEKVMVLRSMMYDYLTYYTNGDYIEKKEISYPRNLFDFTCISDSTVLMTFWFLGSFMKEEVFKEMSAVAGIYDMEGNPIKFIEHPLKNKSISKSDLKRVVSQNPTFTYFDNRVVLSLEGDTIYEITKDSIFPGFIFSWGHLPHKNSIEEIYFRQSEPSNNATYFGSLLETSKKAYIHGKNMDEYYLIEYDKVTGHNRSMSVDIRNSGFNNDLDGGENYFPYWTDRSGSVWIFVEDAFSFKQKHSDDFLSGSSAKYPHLKEKLKNFRDNLRQDDNPVLKIVYLKK